MNDSALTIEHGTLYAVGIRPPRTNSDGATLEPAYALLTFKYDLDRVGAHLNTFGHLLKGQRRIAKLAMEYVEQLEHRIGEPASESDKRSRLSDSLGSFPKNGQGKKGDVADTKPLKPIKGGVQEFLDEMGATGKGKKRRTKEGAHA